MEGLGEAEHESCLIVTSREVPPETGPRAGLQGPVRVLRLEDNAPGLRVRVRVPVDGAYSEAEFVGVFANLPGEEVDALLAKFSTTYGLSTAGQVLTLYTQPGDDEAAIEAFVLDAVAHPKPVPPEAVTMRQARLALLQALADLLDVAREQRRGVRRGEVHPVGVHLRQQEPEIGPLGGAAQPVPVDDPRALAGGALAAGKRLPVEQHLEPQRLACPRLGRVPSCRRPSGPSSFPRGRARTGPA